MERGLAPIGRGHERIPREEFLIIRDEAAFDIVRNFVSPADMQELEGWARSFYTLEGHLDSINAYNKPLLPQPTDPFWIEAKAYVLKEFESFPTIESLSFETGFDLVPFEHSSAAGYGYPGRKGESNNLKRAKRIANVSVRDFAERVSTIGFNEASQQLSLNSTPDVGLTRTQLARLPSTKVRNVFGEAFHYILIEGLSAFPVLSAFKTLNTFYLIGKDPTIEVPAILEEMSTDSRWYMVLDWSAFDASVQNWEIDHAFNCVESILDFPTNLSKTAFDYAKILFKKRKLIGPDGTIWMRNSGIPSGSYYTNLIGSIINYTRIRYLCARTNLSITSMYVQGDDSLTGVQDHRMPDVDLFARIGEPLGWKMKPEKCQLTQFMNEVTFLGRSIRILYNVRDRLKALRLICFPEYKVDDPQISTARVHAIMRDAGDADTLFDQLYCAMYQQHGEAEFIPIQLLPYFEKEFLVIGKPL